MKFLERGFHRFGYVRLVFVDGGAIEVGNNPLLRLNEDFYLGIQRLNPS